MLLFRMIQLLIIYRIDDAGVSHQFVKSNTSSSITKQHRESSSPSSPLVSSAEKPFKSEIRWANVLLFIGIHAAAVYGFYLGVTQAKWATFPWGINTLSSLQNYVNRSLFYKNNLQ